MHVASGTRRPDWVFRQKKDVVLPRGLAGARQAGPPPPGIPQPAPAALDPAALIGLQIPLPLFYAPAGGGQSSIAERSYGEIPHSASR